MVLMLTELGLGAKYLFLQFLLYSSYEKQPHYSRVTQETLKLSEGSNLPNALIIIGPVSFRRFLGPHSLCLSPWVVLVICAHSPAVYTFYQGKYSVY